ncbi:uncharacterized protein FOMMEDRAFT_105676 [Fomitiporia mediterranea MF3/22]|uniref:uncharacterized protein n=1 Tax=Fomitiporia mediterranea (strain MF3/22) TaxID=694068 RepID=UPI00044094CE|nr:uncharacterized protein FOMMEDRAFT_105676 [Fomitiporia mediterranea MF3/22]EJD03578.1 hypothetical protein FOMMEDRAFT_105676 [Fomitiporia mediterranea MF3/22]
MNASTSKTGVNKLSDRKPHVCPSSKAKHPSQRWETAFVYTFILKFTNLRTKIESFEGQPDLEEALLSPTQHPILVQTLSRFVLNLKPQTRNLSPDQLATTVWSILQEHIKSPTERTVFWNDELGMNVDPLQGIEGGIWGADWDLKLRILRMLVELQLTYNPEIKEIIDRAWGVVHNKHRKRDTLPAPLDPSDPHSIERLSTVPIGQDNARVRYWAFDDSPRLYVSTNPWKVTSEFRTIATTKEEYLKVIEDLVSREPKSSKKHTKGEIHLIQLREKLQSRLEAIDQELNRVAKVRRKLEQKEILKAQAELRSTRTRRQTRRPDYVYNQEFDDEDDGDEYKYQDDDDDEEHMELDGEEYGIGRRRSERTATKNANGKRGSDGFVDWRVERRSTRLGKNPDFTIDGGPSTKRARTEERSVSSAPSDTMVSPVMSGNNNGPSKKNGITNVKENEVAVEVVPGKKKSKFWYYAVEPAPGPTPSSPAQSSSTENLDLNGLELNGKAENGTAVNGYQNSVQETNGSGLDAVVEMNEA